MMTDAGFAHTTLYARNATVRAAPCAGLNGTRLLAAHPDFSSRSRVYAVSTEGDFIGLVLRGDKRVSGCRCARSARKRRVEARRSLLLQHNVGLRLHDLSRHVSRLRRGWALAADVLFRGPMRVAPAAAQAINSASANKSVSSCACRTRFRVTGAHVDDAAAKLTVAADAVVLAQAGRLAVFNASGAVTRASRHTLDATLPGLARCACRFCHRSPYRIAGA